MKYQADVLVVSGIPSGASGTGRLVGHLESEIRKNWKNVRLVAKPERLPSWLLFMYLRQRNLGSILVQVSSYVLRLLSFVVGVVYTQLNRKRILVLLHPQNLGYRLSLQLLESRKNPSLLYLLDSSFFCIASYNHIHGENEPCVRCLGGKYGQAQQNKCIPFPRMDWAAIRYVERLRVLVRTGRVQLVAQNIRQAELARHHFALENQPQVIGLWTDDWGSLMPIDGRVLNEESELASSWDVVFHGHCLEPKGALWLTRLAGHCRELTFLFPFARPAWLNAPSNCSFQNINWENGLKEAVASAWCTAVPSLWSAPIEGALIKSLAVAPRVAVVANQSSFADEIPEKLVLRLPRDPIEAATVLLEARKMQWCPDPGEKLDWLRKFNQQGKEFVDKLLVNAMDCAR
jgi:hypothetical protein